MEVDAKWDADWVKYMIEEHDCPGTGQVGAAVAEVIRKADEKSVCWVCNLRGRNEVIGGLPHA